MSKMNGRGLAHVFGRAGHLANSCAKPVDLRGHRQRPVPASVTSKLNTLAGKPFHWLTIFEFDVVDDRVFGVSLWPLFYFGASIVYPNIAICLAVGCVDLDCESDSESRDQRTGRNATLDFSEMLSEQFLQFARPRDGNRIAFNAQQFAIAEFCQRP